MTTSSRQRPSSFDIAGAWAVTIVRAGAGVSARLQRKRPEQLLVLYEFEACPYCRLVREVLTELDLDAEIRPCPKGGKRFRDALLERGGKLQFPYLIDPNTQKELYESAAVIQYLFRTYGDGLPLRRRFGWLQPTGSKLAGAFRPLSGVHARPSRLPAQPLELYSFEANPRSRLVRERLCELELPYVLHSSGLSTVLGWMPSGLRKYLHLDVRSEIPNRRLLRARAGHLSLPYLVDPNSGEGMAGLGDIADYLERTYAL